MSRVNPEGLVPMAEIWAQTNVKCEDSILCAVGYLRRRLDKAIMDQKQRSG